MKKYFLFGFIISILFGGCAGMMRLNTPSGKPEVTLKNRSMKEVKDALVREMLNQNFTIKSTSDYTIVFSKPMDSFLASFLLGSRYDATPEHRVTAMIVESNNGVRIVLTNQGITNPGSAFERVTDMSTGKAGQSWHEFLSNFDNLFKGRIGISFNENGTLTSVTSGGPADEAGLQRGDRILTVDGKRFYHKMSIAGDPETMVKLEVDRGGEKITFEVVRKILK